jgi:glycosyltransferase involved in cell wall biosynthesis
MATANPSLSQQVAARAPAVTVLMPAYNAGSLLRQAVDSILAQTFTDFECLIIDDGSRDGSVEALQTIGDPRLRIVLNPRNLGLVATLNYGIELARAPLIARMDADDISLPDRLHCQVEAFRLRPGLGLLGSWAEVIDAAGRTAGHIQLPIEHRQIALAMLRDNVFVHPSVMVRASVLRDLGGYPVDFPAAEDYAMWLRILLRHEVANLPKTLVQYRIHAAQISQVNIREQRLTASRLQSWAHSAYIRHGILDIRSIPSKPSVWGHLTAASGTLGCDYKQWARRYWRLGVNRKASSLALAGLTVAPLSVELWRMLTPPQASPRYWWDLFRSKTKA